MWQGANPLCRLFCQGTGEHDPWHHALVDIKLVSEITGVQVIAAGRGIREFDRLQRVLLAGL